METAHRKLKIELLATRNTLLQNTINHSKYITITFQLEKYKFDFRSDHCIKMRYSVGQVQDNL